MEPSGRPPPVADRRPLAELCHFPAAEGRVDASAPE
jgi:hypothetical protein